jgi:hypothetical protein
MGAIASAQSSGINISLVDPAPAWRSGNHFLCDSGTEWINKIVARAQSGSTPPGPDGLRGYDVPGPASFHPKDVGASEFATLIDARLAGTG